MACVLVATDGSEGANRAVDYAAHLAKSRGAELLIAYVIGGYGVPDKLFRQFTRAQQVWLQEQLESDAKHILTSARERAHNIGVSVIFLESQSGDVAQSIIEIAREKNAEAIVIGKRGVGRIAGLLLGSVSQKIVSLSPIPVTVIP